jgi:Mn2+/Fe2+ NRAMP family transporter
MGIFTVLIVAGAVVSLIPGLPLIDVLVGVYVLNGLLLPIALFAIMTLVNNRELMGDFVNTPLQQVFAWIIVSAVSALSLIYIIWTIFF